MRLIHPSPGELADRQSILELKIEYGASEISSEQKIEGSKVVRNLTRNVITAPTRVNIIPFKEELEAVIKYNVEHWLPGIQEDDSKVQLYDKLYDDLFEVNHNLWKLEDEARILRAAPDKYQAQAAVRAAEVLFSINDENDKRAEVIKQINSIWNITHQEKMYQS